MIRGIPRTDINVPAGQVGLFPQPDGNWYSKDGTSGVIKAIGSLNPDYGADRVSAEKEVTETVTGTTPDTYLSMTITNTALANKIFELYVDYRWSYSAGNNDFRGQIWLDNQLISRSEIRQEPKDTGADQRHPGPFIGEAELTPGNHTLEIRYFSANGGNQARMHSAYMKSIRAGNP